MQCLDEQRQVRITGDYAVNRIGKKERENLFFTLAGVDQDQFGIFPAGLGQFFQSVGVTKNDMRGACRRKIGRLQGGNADIGSDAM